MLTCERAAGELDEETNEFLTCSAELVSSLAGQYLECYQAFSAAGGAEEAEEALRLVYEHVELVWRFLVCVLTHTVASRSALSSSPVVERRRHTCRAAGAGPRRPKHTSARAHSIILVEQTRALEACAKRAVPVRVCTTSARQGAEDDAVSSKCFEFVKVFVSQCRAWSEAGVFEGQEVGAATCRARMYFIVISSNGQSRAECAPVCSTVERTHAAGRLRLTPAVCVCVVFVLICCGPRAGREHGARTAATVARGQGQVPCGL